MAIDYQASLYDPVYTALGVTATIALDGTAGEFSLTVIDKTAGIDVSGDVNVASIKPAAAVRMAELVLNGIERASLYGGTITLNGVTWRIDATAPRPAPTGENEGELYLVLSRADGSS
jgi:hypothetical protein